MKIKNTWTVKEDQEFGGLGLFMKGWPSNFNPAQGGRILAHDIIEHNVDKNYGTVENELQALGAMMLVRGSWNCYNPRSQEGYADSIADEIVTQIRRYEMDFVKDAPRIVWGPVRYEFGSFAALRRRIRRKCQAEDCEMPEWSLKDIRNIVRWLDIGYTKAVKLYGRSEGRLYGLFAEIERKFPKYLYEGQEFKTVIDTDNGMFYIDEIYLDDDEDADE